MTAPIKPKKPKLLDLMKQFGLGMTADMVIDPINLITSTLFDQPALESPMPPQTLSEKASRFGGSIATGVGAGLKGGLKLLGKVAKEAPSASGKTLEELFENIPSPRNADEVPSIAEFQSQIEPPHVYNAREHDLNLAKAERVELSEDAIDNALLPYDALSDSEKEVVELFGVKMRPKDISDIPGQHPFGRLMAINDPAMTSFGNSTMTPEQILEWQRLADAANIPGRSILSIPERAERMLGASDLGIGKFFSTNPSDIAAHMTGPQFNKSADWIKWGSNAGYVPGPETLAEIFRKLGQSK